MDRRRSVVFLVTLLVLAACQRSSPTEPQIRERALAENVHGVSVSPSQFRIGVGQVVTARGSLDRAGPEVWFLSSDKTVAEVSGKIAFGKESTTVQIRGVSPGQAEILYMIPNFGRPPGSGRAGSITVVNDLPPPPPQCAAPEIRDHPAGGTIRRGEQITLGAASNGSPPLAWQWFSDDGDGALEPISGATDQTYRTPPLDATTEYAVSATNSCGQAISNRARIVVLSSRRRAARH